MDVRRLLGLTVLLAYLGVAACDEQEPQPRIHSVSPTTIVPGGMVLITGADFRPDDVVLVNGRPAARVTWVNASLLAALVPAELAGGTHAVAVAPASGRPPAGDAAVHHPLVIETPRPVATRPPPNPDATRPRVTVTVPPRASGDDDDDDD